MAAAAAGQTIIPWGFIKPTMTPTVLADPISDYIKLLEKTPEYKPKVTRGDAPIALQGLRAFYSYSPYGGQVTSEQIQRDPAPFYAQVCGDAFSRWSHARRFDSGGKDFISWALFPAVYSDDSTIISYCQMVVYSSFPLDQTVHPLCNPHYLPVKTVPPHAANIMFDARYIYDDNAHWSVESALNVSDAVNGSFITFFPFIDMQSPMLGRIQVDNPKSWKLSGASMGLATMAAIMGLPAMLYTGFTKAISPDVIVRKPRPYPTGYALSQYSQQQRSSMDSRLAGFDSSTPLQEVSRTIGLIESVDDLIYKMALAVSIEVPLVFPAVSALETPIRSIIMNRSFSKQLQVLAPARTFYTVAQLEDAVSPLHTKTFLYCAKSIADVVSLSATAAIACQVEFKLPVGFSGPNAELYLTGAKRVAAAMGRPDLDFAWKRSAAATVGEAVAERALTKKRAETDKRAAAAAALKGKPAAAKRKAKAEQAKSTLLKRAEQRAATLERQVKEYASKSEALQQVLDAKIAGTYQAPPKVKFVSLKQQAMDAYDKRNPQPRGGLYLEARARKLPVQEIVRQERAEAARARFRRQQEEGIPLTQEGAGAAPTRASSPVGVAARSAGDVPPTAQLRGRQLTLQKRSTGEMTETTGLEGQRPLTGGTKLEE